MKLTSRLVLVILGGLFVTALAAPAATVLAVDGWSYTGSAGVSDGSSNYPQIDVSSNGVPYVAYCEAEDLSPCLLSVKRFNGTSWKLVGPARFSAGDASIIIMKISPTGVPYVAYGDGSVGNYLTVQRFDGTSWELVGTAGFSDGMPDGHDLAFASDGTPYVVYANSSDNRKPTVARFNGTSWEQVGPASFSDGSAAGIALALTPDNVPYVVYQDASHGVKLVAKRFNGTSWETVGADGFTPGAALPDADGFAINAEGIPYVAFMDVSSGVKMSVMRFNGTSWEQVGSAGFSDGTVSDTRLTFTSADVPYVVYRDSANGDKPTVQRFDGTSWEVVGSAGFTPAAGYSAVIAMSNRDAPYVAYIDGGNDYKLSVERFDTGPDELPDPTTIAVPNAEDTKTVNITSSFGTVLTCNSTTKEQSLTKSDSNYDYVGGLVTYCFNTDFTNNQVSLVFVTDLRPNQVTVRKYNSSMGVYTTISDAIVTSTTYNGQPALNVTYAVVDNGPLDEDPAIGAITDPVGLGTVAGVATVGAPNTGIGHVNATFSATALLSTGSTMLALALILRRRMRSGRSQ